MFTTTDKSLLDRAARHQEDKAKVLEKTYGQNSWGTDKQSRKAKLKFDRLQRDARDLRALAKRLTGFAKQYNGAKSAEKQQTYPPVPGVPLGGAE